MPILESSITLIAGDTLYYRGHDAVELAASRSIGEVASLIWTGQFDAPLAAVAGTAAEKAARPAAPKRRLPFIPRAQSMVAVASTHDPLACDLRPDSVALTGWRIVDLLTRAASEARGLDPRSSVARGLDARSSEARGLDARSLDGRAPTSPIDERLARTWGVRRGGGDILRAALILCADHELNVSAFTARCVASSGSNPYAVVIAGLAALEGVKHGGMTARVESMLHSVRREHDLRAALADRLRRGETIDGFGHPLYRNGDPRATALLAMLADCYPRSPERAFAAGLADAAGSVLREQPTLDYALATVARVLRLPTGAPLTLFAIGRAIGWIGHAIEQYATNQIIRPRAKYVGEMPESGRVG